MNDAVLQGVGEGSVAAVVEQDGQRCGFKFLIRDLIALAPQQLYAATHEVHGAETVGESGVVGTGIHEVGHADLLDASKALEIRMFDDVEMQLVRDADEAIDGVVEDLLFVGCACHVPLFLPQR